MKKQLILKITVLLLLSVVVSNAEILVDGRFDDWQRPPSFSDPLNDGINDGIDFSDMFVTQEYGWLILRIKLNHEVLLQDESEILLLIDSDNNSETGLSENGLGVELVWNFGERYGSFYSSSGQATSFIQGELGVISAPTVSGEEFEIAINLSARINDRRVFDNDSIRIELKNNTSGGDRCPDSNGYLFELIENSATPELLPIEKENPLALRFMTWNVLWDGIIERSESFGRIAQAIKPDMVVFEEVWETTAFQIGQLMNDWLPLDEGSWCSDKLEGDIIIASKWPILSSWDVPGARATAFLAEAPAPFEGPVFVIGAHPPSGNNENGRQYAVDAIMAFLRDAITEGGDIDIDHDTPIIITGDMNLVGWDEQLRTLIYGDIINQDELGPSFIPDWDGTPLKDLFPRHPSQMFVYTWRNQESAFTPGKLDYIIISDSNLEVVQSFVFDSATLPDSMRMASGVYYVDSATASDHIPAVADLLPHGVNKVERSSRSALPDLNWGLKPNPFNPSLNVSVNLKAGHYLNIKIYDMLGREIRELVSEDLSAGSYAFVWNGKNQTGSCVSSGNYFVCLAIDGKFHESRKVTFLK